jgi:hypothetical protein
MPDEPQSGAKRSLEVGDYWAYRARSTDPLVCVEVLRVGTARPPRVHVRFVDDQYEGRQEWVSPARLKVRWEDADEWLAEERRWDALRAASQHVRDTPEERAADLVLDSLHGWDLAEAGFNSNTGVLVIRDVDALVAETGLDRELLTGDPLAIETSGGEWFVPWPVMRQVVERLATVHADTVMAAVEEDERQDRHHATWGHLHGHGQRASYVSAEICASVSAEHGYQAGRDLVRQWCGGEALDRYDELRALRAEVTRLGQLVERAVAVLRSSGNSREADGLERDLGVPIEVVQHQAKDQRSSGP